MEMLRNIFKSAVYLLANHILYQVYKNKTNLIIFLSLQPPAQPPHTFLANGTPVQLRSQAVRQLQANRNPLACQG